jgi:uncharacterized protein YjbJ (UPF0337 family)
MNPDQFKDVWNEFKGELQRQWGRFTDDDLREIGGNYTKFLGLAKERYGDQRRIVEQWAKRWVNENCHIGI